MKTHFTYALVAIAVLANTAFGEESTKQHLRRGLLHDNAGNSQRKLWSWSVPDVWSWVFNSSNQEGDEMAQGADIGGDDQDAEVGTTDHGQQENAEEEEDGKRNRM